MLKAILNRIRAYRAGTKSDCPPKAFMPRYERKCWGSALHIFASPHAAVSCLSVDVGWRCSRHWHRDRANLFAVLSGCMVVEEWPDGLEGRKAMAVLNPGGTHAVPSGTWHRFRVMRSGKVVEVYWPDGGGEVDVHDIERIDFGGLDDAAELKLELEARGLV